MNNHKKFMGSPILNEIPVRGYHRHMNEQAYMDIRLLSLVKVQYMDGKKMDISERLLFSMICVVWLRQP